MSWLSGLAQFHYSIETIQLNNQSSPSYFIMQNERGQGVSHATESKVPGKVYIGWPCFRQVSF
jgi:hypothetical protein